MEKILREVLNEDKTLLGRCDELIAILEKKVPGNLSRDFAPIKRALLLNVGEKFFVGNEDKESAKNEVAEILKSSGMQETRINFVIETFTKALDWDKPQPPPEEFAPLVEKKVDEQKKLIEIHEEEKISASNVQENSVQKNSVQAIMQKAMQEKISPQNKVMEEYLKKKSEVLNAQKNSSANTEEQTRTQDKPSPPVASFHVLDENFHDLFLKRDGRLNRLRFFKRNILADIITVVAFVFIYVIMSSMTHDEKIIEFVSLTAAIGVNCYLSYGLIVRRSHDLHSKNFWANSLANDDEIIAKCFVGITILFSIVAFATDYDKANMASSALFFYLVFAKGEVGANKFGSDPLGPAVYKNDPSAYNPQNYQNFSKNNYTQNSPTENFAEHLKKFSNNKPIFLGSIILLVCVLGFLGYYKSTDRNPAQAIPTFFLGETDEKYIRLGDEQIEQKNYLQAVGHYKKATELNPQNANAWFGLGYADSLQGDYFHAVKAYQKVIEINPKEGNAYNNLGVAYVELNDYNNAISAYQKVVEINPQDD